MGYWGLAYALGPNYNKPWEVFDKQELESNVREGHRAAASARDRVKSATLVETALCGAIQHRYPKVDPSGDRSYWNKQYADSMKQVYEKSPEDLDVATLYADSLMNLTP